MSGDEPRPEGRPEDHHLHRTGLRRSSRVPWIVLGVALVAAAAVALWLRLRTPVQAPVAEPAAVAPAPEAAPSPDATPAPGPEQVRSLLEAISSHPLFRAGLGGDPVRR